MAQHGGESKFGAWRTRHNAMAVRKVPRQSRAFTLAGAAFWSLFAVLLFVVGWQDRDGSIFLVGAGLVLLAAYMAWRGGRFILADECCEADGALDLSSKRWRVQLRATDVRRISQLRSNPFGGVFDSMPLAAWGAWVRIDATPEGKRRRYLVWDQDSVALLGRLKAAGYPVEGDVIRVPQPDSDG